MSVSVNNVNSHSEKVKTVNMNAFETPKTVECNMNFRVPRSPDYNVEFFRKFQLVMNALDNRGIKIYSIFQLYMRERENTLFCCSPKPDRGSFVISSGP